MRLIDADAFKEYMRKALEETRGCYPDKGEWAEAVTEQFCKDIDDQPTIEPERKKGKWIDEGFYADGHGAHAFRCSECGGHIIEYDVDPFCKWCGAKMKGDKDENKNS